MKEIPYHNRLETQNNTHNTTEQNARSKQKYENIRKYSHNQIFLEANTEAWTDFKDLQKRKNKWRKNRLNTHQRTKRRLKGRDLR